MTLNKSTCCKTIYSTTKHYVQSAGTILVALTTPIIHQWHKLPSPRSSTSKAGPSTIHHHPGKQSGLIQRERIRHTREKGLTPSRDSNHNNVYDFHRGTAGDVVAATAAVVDAAVVAGKSGAGGMGTSCSISPKGVRQHGHS
jgi:hypothetical protein